MTGRVARCCKTSLVNSCMKFNGAHNVTGRNSSLWLCNSQVDVCLFLDDVMREQGLVVVKLFSLLALKVS